MNILEAIKANEKHCVARSDEKDTVGFVFEPGDLKRFNEFTYAEVVADNWINADSVSITVSLSKLRKAFSKHADPNSEAFVEFLSDVRSK